MTSTQSNTLDLTQRVRDEITSMNQAYYATAVSDEVNSISDAPQHGNEITHTPNTNANSLSIKAILGYCAATALLFYSLTGVVVLDKSQRKMDLQLRKASESLAELRINGYQMSMRLDSLHHKIDSISAADKQSFCYKVTYPGIDSDSTAGVDLQDPNDRVFVCRAGIYSGGGTR